MAAAKSSSNTKNSKTKSASTRSNSSKRSQGSSSGRKTSGRTSTGTGRGTRAAVGEQMVMDEEEYRLAPERIREIYLFIFFAINLVLVLGTYGVCGKIGKVVSGFFFGIFGASFYILPFFF